MIARFGTTVNWPLDADGVSRLVNDVIAATSHKSKIAGAHKSYCRPSCVAFATRSNRSSDRIASAS